MRNAGLEDTQAGINSMGSQESDMTELLTLNHRTLSHRTISSHTKLKTNFYLEIILV